MQGAHENHHCICFKETSTKENSYKSGPLLKITATFQTKTLENLTQHMDMSTEKNVMHEE
ncbi:hypothetical protein HanPSC8_Chr08g0341161 [Helianthus annuus]|nr:hypothetical protein HanPSC8_Chr08g0341161 [Helianthus annuus]